MKLCTNPQSPKCQPFTNVPYIPQMSTFHQRPLYSMGLVMQVLAISLYGLLSLIIVLSLKKISLDYPMNS